MLRPFDARVVVQKPERKEQTASGIILPDGVDEAGQTAEEELLFQLDKVQEIWLLVSIWKYLLK